MVRKNFARRKAEIQAETRNIMEYIQKMLDIAIECLLDSEDIVKLEAAVQQIQKMDHEVNNYEEAIYHYCIQLISLEQPVASDLRFSIGVLKFIGDIERIGDHCVHLIKNTLRNAQLTIHTRIPEELIEMARRISQVYYECYQAVEQLDADSAQQIIREEEQLNEMHKQFIKGNARLIQSSPELADSFVHFMFLSRFIERIGDHVVNICEWLIFMREGTRPL